MLSASLATRWETPKLPCLPNSRLASLERNGLEAVQMSTFPLIKASIPVAVPPPSTYIEMPGCSFIYSSAHRRAKITIVSEPLRRMVEGVSMRELLQFVDNHKQAAAMTSMLCC